MGFYIDMLKNDFLFSEDTVFECPFHVNSYAELLHIASGSVRMKFVDKNYDLKKGDVVLIFPNKIHCFVDESDDLIVERVMVSPLFLKNYSVFFEQYTSIDVVINKDSQFYFEILSLLNLIKKDMTYDKTIMSGYVISIMGLALKCVKLKKVKLKKINYIENILNYCNNHYNENITIDSVADALFITRSYLSYIFKNEMNIKFKDYINMLRISKACMLIKSGSCSITEAAYDSGFDTIRTFNRVFLRLVGQTPTEYKKSNFLKLQ